MSDSIKMPSDIRQLPPFRDLCSLLNSAAQALLLWWILFEQLKYLIQEGGAVGRIVESEVPSFRKVLDDITRESGCILAASSAFDLLVQAKLLKADGPDYVCPRFQVLNAGEGTLSSIGGSMKAFKARQREIEPKTRQLSLSIHESKFVDTDGNALDAEMVKRVTRAIIACDNALFKPQRPPAGYSEGLIQSALDVCRNFKDEDIDFVCEQVALHRKHPALMGYTTERMLPEFKNMIGRVGANG